MYVLYHIVWNGVENTKVYWTRQGEWRDSLSGAERYATEQEALNARPHGVVEHEDTPQFPDLWQSTALKNGNELVPYSSTKRR